MLQTNRIKYMCQKNTTFQKWIIIKFNYMKILRGMA